MKHTDSTNWTPIPNMNDRYEIRSIGGVIEVRSWHKRGLGQGRRSEPVVLKRGPNGMFPLTDPEGRKIRWNGARWLLITFVGEPPFEGALAAHWDGNPYNNDLSNLRWASCHEVALRRFEGRKGEEHPQSKLNAAAVRKIIASPEVRQHVLAEKFGVHQNAISRVRTGKTWRHITGISSD